MQWCMQPWSAVGSVGSQPEVIPAPAPLLASPLMLSLPRCFFLAIALPLHYLQHINTSSFLPLFNIICNHLISPLRSMECVCVCVWRAAGGKVGAGNHKPPAMADLGHGLHDVMMPAVHKRRLHPTHLLSLSHSILLHDGHQP